MGKVRKVYLAARFSRREEIEKLSHGLPSVGMVSVSRWLLGGEEGLSYRDIAVLDLEDINLADTIILFSHHRSEPQPGGGRLVEFGYAYGRGKRCIVIGPTENVFIEAPGVEQYDNWRDFLSTEGLRYHGR